MLDILSLYARFNCLSNGTAMPLDSIICDVDETITASLIRLQKIIIILYNVDMEYSFDSENVPEYL